MVRLIIIVLLAYFAYKLFKNLFRIGPGSSRKNGPEGAISEMVEDPFCKTYVPRNEAYRAVVNGEELFFCSKECAEKFKKGNRRDK